MNNFAFKILKPDIKYINMRIIYIYTFLFHNYIYLFIQVPYALCVHHCLNHVNMC